MTLRSPLAVRVSNGRADQHVTRQISDLDFSSTAPGGFDAASFELARPIEVDDPLLALESRVYIYDTRTAEVCWEGKLTDPGRSFSDAGQTWSLTAMGPKMHASDRFRPYIPIDRTLDGWFRKYNNTPAATADASSNPVDATKDGLVLMFPAGSLITTGSSVAMEYDQYLDNGLLLGGVGYSHVSGAAFAAQEIQMRVDGITYNNSALSATPASPTPASADGVGSFPSGSSYVVFRLERISGGATTVSTDTMWVCVYNVWVRQLLYTKAGVAISGPGTYTNSYVLASDIVADLLGRWLVQYDGPGATIDATAYQIDQLAYPDGVRPADVLDDLNTFSTPDRRWMAWESNAAGLYRFEWDTWGASPRYEASTVDGFESPGSSAELYNRVTVVGTDARGRKQSVRCNNPVDALGTTLREADVIDLGSEVYSAANAQLVGDRFLADHAVPPNAGTLTVQRPIRDLISGRMVNPWQIRPGSLIRIRGVNANPDSLNRTDRDGVTVFRLTGTSFKDSDQSATLTLDSPTHSIENLIGVLGRQRTRAKK